MPSTIRVVVGDGVGAVDVLEVGEVDVVLGHLLAAGGHVELDHLVGQPLGVEELGHLGHVVERLALLEVVPGPDHLVALDARVRADPCLARDPIHVAVGDLVALAAVAVVAPTVERAADAVALDPTADPEVGAQVGAVGVDHVRAAILAPEQHDVLRRTPGIGAHLARGQVTGLGDDEPAVGDREREPRLGSSGVRTIGRRVRSISDSGSRGIGKPANGS